MTQKSTFPKPPSVQDHLSLTDEVSQEHMTLCPSHTSGPHRYSAVQAQTRAAAVLGGHCVAFAKRIAQVYVCCCAAVDVG